MSDDTTLPPGDYAIVELFGHTSLIGRIAEIERFGNRMLQIEPLFRGELLPAVFYGGSAIYGITPCSATTALRRHPQQEYGLPATIRATLQPAALPPPIDGGAEEDPPGDEF
ncbi:MAG: hypothetical protein KGN77_01970 [Xanthomonadaceae bacterium]|nr:hypothetical protein [Xanthomonadaceae bacterium]